VANTLGADPKYDADAPLQDVEVPTRPTPAGVVTALADRAIPWPLDVRPPRLLVRPDSNWRRPHCPETLVGFRTRFLLLGIVIDTGANSGQNVLQHSSRPQDANSSHPLGLVARAPWRMSTRT